MSFKMVSLAFLERWALVLVPRNKQTGTFFKLEYHELKKIMSEFGFDFGTLCLLESNITTGESSGHKVLLKLFL